MNTEYRFDQYPAIRTLGTEMRENSESSPLVLYFVVAIASGVMGACTAILFQLALAWVFVAYSLGGAIGVLAAAFAVDMARSCRATMSQTRLRRDPEIGTIDEGRLGL